MTANFYNMIFVEDNFLPFHREGIPVTIKDEYVYINGLGNHRIFNEPEKIEDRSKLSDIFNNYSAKSPWIGKENEDYYLYRGQINDEHLDFETNEEKYVYLRITTKEADEITVLNGKIFFKIFADGEQIALVRFSENTMLTIEKDEGLIMIEIENGKFICR